MQGRRVVDGAERPKTEDSMDDLIQDKNSGKDKKSKKISSQSKNKTERKEAKAAEQRTAIYAKAPPRSKGKHDDDELMNPSEMLDVGL